MITTITNTTETGHREGIGRRAKGAITVVMSEWTYPERKRPSSSLCEERKKK